MAWWDSIRNVLVPKPAAQGLPLSYAPAGAVAKEMTGGAADTYGNLVEVLSNAGNTSDAWVYALLLVNPDTAQTTYSVALSREAAGAAPTKIEAQVPHLSEKTVIADDHEIVPLDPPVYFPSGTGIRAACKDFAAGGKKISVFALISRGRG